MYRTKFLTFALAVLLVRVASAQSISFKGTTLSSGSNTAEGIVAGDFNKDGKLDLVVVNPGTDSFSYLEGLGNGTFAAPVTFSASASGAFPLDIVAADFNNDGNLDVAIVHPTTTNQGFGNAVTVHLGDGKGGFSSPGLVFFTGGTDTGIVVADFNEDGVPDLAISSCDAGAVYIHQGNGDGTFSLIRTLPVAQCGGTATFAVQVADLNNDNHADLIAATPGDNQTVSVFLGDGAGDFGPRTRFPIVGNFPSSIGVGDFNRDGNPDLAVTNFNDNTVSILLGDGTGGLTLKGTHSVGATPFFTAVADVNHDGLLDVIASNYGATNLTVLLGNGSGGFKAPISVPTGTAPRYLAIADFNVNGLTDLAVADTGVGNITVLNNTLGACITSVSPAAHTAISTGGVVSLKVSAPAGCGWGAVGRQSWLTVPFGSSGTGNGAVEVNVAPNYGVPRNGTVSIGGKSLKVTQN